MACHTHTCVSFVWRARLPLAPARFHQNMDSTLPHIDNNRWAAKRCSSTFISAQENGFKSAGWHLRCQTFADSAAACLYHLLVNWSRVHFFSIWLFQLVTGGMVLVRTHNQSAKSNKLDSMYSALIFTCSENWSGRCWPNRDTKSLGSSAGFFAPMFGTQSAAWFYFSGRHLNKLNGRCGACSGERAANTKMLLARNEISVVECACRCNNLQFLFCCIECRLTVEFIYYIRSAYLLSCTKEISYTTIPVCLFARLRLTSYSHSQMYMAFNDLNTMTACNAFKLAIVAMNVWMVLSLLFHMPAPSICLFLSFSRCLHFIISVAKKTQRYPIQLKSLHIQHWMLMCARLFRCISFTATG